MTWVSSCPVSQDVQNKSSINDFWARHLNLSALIYRPSFMNPMNCNFNFAEEF